MVAARSSNDAPFAQVELSVGFLVDVLNLNERSVFVLVYFAPAQWQGTAGVRPCAETPLAEARRAFQAICSPLVAEDPALAVQSARLALGLHLRVAEGAGRQAKARPGTGLRGRKRGLLTMVLVRRHVRGLTE